MIKNNNSHSPSALRLEAINQEIVRLNKELTVAVESTVPTVNREQEAKLAILPSFFGVTTLMEVANIILSLGKKRKDWKRLTTAEKALAVAMLKNKERVVNIARILGVSRPTIYSIKGEMAA